MTLDQLQVYVKVVQSGSFTRAAELMGSSKGYLSRVLTQLEAELGVKLLARTTRTLSVTETGKEVFERAVGILTAVDETQRIAQDAQGEPRGQLRLTCGVEFGMLAVAGWIDRFLARHPLVSCDVEYTSRVIDLVHEGFDLAIRIGPLPDSRLVARKLGTIEYGLFACPRYLQRCGTPATVDDLRLHSLVMFSGGTHRGGWTLSLGRERIVIEGAARLRTNNSFAVRDALLRSLGIGRLPLLIAAEEVKHGRLVPVLNHWQTPSADVHAVYPSSRYLAPKVRGFIDLAAERFPLAADEARRATDAACARAAAD
jgi:LysR family transcriptional regulator, regulator for bpeEF and oprC